jgi:hypothetical protein
LERDTRFELATSTLAKYIHGKIALLKSRNCLISLRRTVPKCHLRSPHFTPNGTPKGTPGGRAYLFGVVGWIKRVFVCFFLPWANRRFEPRWLLKPSSNLGSSQDRAENGASTLHFGPKSAPKGTPGGRAYLFGVVGCFHWISLVASTVCGLLLRNQRLSGQKRGSGGPWSEGRSRCG